MTNQRLPIINGLAIAVSLLLLASAALTLTGVLGSASQPPEIKIMADIDGNPIVYELLPNQWNGKKYDRLHYAGALFPRVQAGTVPVCSITSLITFDFAGREPDKLSLQVDYYTNPVWSYWMEPEEVPLDGLSFAHPPRPDYPTGPAGWSIRFYVLTAAWGENEVEYAFAVDVIGEPFDSGDTTDGLALLGLKADRVDWLEISPALSLTTYVEDREYIDQVVTLVNTMRLRRLTAEEAIQAKTAEPDPGELTINGSTYPRVIRLDFRRRTTGSGQTGSENLGSILLKGGYLQVNDAYYAPVEPLTDEFIAILDSIHHQADSPQHHQPPLTLEVVRALAAGEVNPEAIINTYAGDDITSGIHSFYTELPDDYAFMIGYVKIAKPLYIRLIDTRTDEFIDPTSQSIDEFLSRRED